MFRANFNWPLACKYIHWFSVISVRLSMSFCICFKMLTSHLWYEHIDILVFWIFPCFISFHLLSEKLVTCDLMVTYGQGFLCLFLGGRTHRYTVPIVLTVVPAPITEYYLNLLPIYERILALLKVHTEKKCCLLARLMQGGCGGTFHLCKYVSFFATLSFPFAYESYTGERKNILD